MTYATLKERSYKFDGEQDVPNLNNKTLLATIRKRFYYGTPKPDCYCVVAYGENFKQVITKIISK
jgi:hypothetical protein